jgi:hypothetical protein
MQPRYLECHKTLNNGAQENTHTLVGNQQIPKGSNNGVQDLESLGCFFTLSIINLETTLSNRPNRAGVSTTHERTETDPVSETLCSLVFLIPDDGQRPKPQQLREI